MNDFLRALLFLPPQASELAFSLDRLHYFVILTTMVGATLVFSIATALLVRFRRRVEQRPTTPHVTMPVKLEVALIGGTLSLFLVWWTIGFLQYIEQQTPPRDAMTVYVTAKQWMWKFAYPEGHTSINVLTVPRGRPVRLVMTSRDVIHSFFVPAFRNKQDVIPGTYTSLWFEATVAGSYPVYCAELCGLEHSEMRAVVVVLDPPEYEAWLRGAAPSHARSKPPARPPYQNDLAAEGLEVAARHGCLACHTLDGQRHIGPSWAGLYGTQRLLSSGETALADEAYLTRAMMDPRAEIVAGFAPLMPTYFGALSAAETGALIELIRSLRELPIPEGVGLMSPAPAAEEVSE